MEQENYSEKDFLGNLFKNWANRLNGIDIAVLSLIYLYNNQGKTFITKEEFENALSVKMQTIHKAIFRLYAQGLLNLDHKNKEKSYSVAIEKLAA